MSRIKFEVTIYTNGLRMVPILADSVLDGASRSSLYNARHREQRKSAKAMAKKGIARFTLLALACALYIRLLFRFGAFAAVIRFSYQIMTHSLACSYTRSVCRKRSTRFYRAFLLCVQPQEIPCSSIGSTKKILDHFRSVDRRAALENCRSVFSGHIFIQ